MMGISVMMANRRKKKRLSQKVRAEGFGALTGYGLLGVNPSPGSSCCAGANFHVSLSRKLVHCYLCTYVGTNAIQYLPNKQ
jgi:hypothetical protein